MLATLIGFVVIARPSSNVVVAAVYYAVCRDATQPAAAAADILVLAVLVAFAARESLHLAIAVPEQPAVPAVFVKRRTKTSIPPIDETSR